MSDTYIISEVILSIYNILDSNKLEINIGLGIIPIKINNKEGNNTSGE